MKRFFTYILAALFSLYLLVSLAWGNAAARHRLYKGFSVTVVDSARAQYVTVAEVAAYLSKHIKADENTLLQDINTEDLEEQLYQNRLIEEVRCYKTPSGLLRVDISQRVPILRVLGDSAAYFLDEHGKLMPANLSEAVAVPVATGHISSAYARETLYPFARFLQKNDFWRAQVEQIYVDAHQNVELTPRVGDHRILMGKLTAYEEKLDNLRCLYEQAFSKCGWNKYSIINLKYKNQVVCTRRK